MKILIKNLEKFNSFFPISIDMQKSIKNFLDVKYNYNSNAIEWTTLSEAETILVLKWETVPKHSLIEHFEVINHRKAFNFIWELTNWLNKSNNDWKNIFNEENLLKIHSIILNNINDENAWIYRRHNVKIAFSRAILPRWEKVYDMMKIFLEKYNDLYLKIDKNNIEQKLKYWYDLHLDFVKIHPFIDWNGRTARLLQNMFFLNELNNLNIVYFKNRNNYIKTIDESDNNLESYYNFMNKNFLDFKKEELELLEENIYFKY